MDFFERLTNLLKVKKIKQAELAEYCDIRPSTISDWKTKKTMPQVDTAIKIAKRLGVSLDYLLIGFSGEKEDVMLTPDEDELLKNYRELTSDMKSMINIQIAALAIRK